VNLGEKISRTFFVISYPRYLSDNWFSPIVNLDRIFDISIFIHPIDTSHALKAFQKKVTEVQSQISTREEKGYVRDPILDTAYQDLEGLRDKLQQATEKLFDVAIYITIYADNNDELNKLESEIKSLLDSKLVYVRPALFQQSEGFKSTIPIETDLIESHSKLNSEPLSSIFPFVSFDLTSDKGILFGINRHNSSLVLFDRFSLANYNSVTFASSGAGKSYATKLEIIRTLMFDAEVIVIDPEKEYNYLAEATEGRYFNFSHFRAPHQPIRPSCPQRR
jgi:conjugal transfer ATP-binding protein TraC